MCTFQWVGSIDMTENPVADANILVQGENDFVKQEREVIEAIKGLLNDEKIEAVICVAVSFLLLRNLLCN